jgi:hypothetical protein
MEKSSDIEKVLSTSRVLESDSLSKKDGLRGTKNVESSDIEKIQISKKDNYTEDSDLSDLSETDVPKDQPPKPKWNPRTTTKILESPLPKSVFYPTNIHTESYSGMHTNTFQSKTADASEVLSNRVFKFLEDKKRLVKDKIELDVFIKDMIKELSLMLDKAEAILPESCFLTQPEPVCLEIPTHVKTSNAPLGGNIPSSSVLLKRLSNRRDNDLFRRSYMCKQLE